MEITTNKQRLREPSLHLYYGDYSRVEQLLRATLVKYPSACGVSAPQIEIQARAFAIRRHNDDGLFPTIQCFINPIVTSHQKQYRTTEGCLSLPEQSFEVTRFHHIVIHDALHGGQEFYGLDAQVIQHEFDHLNGILICDIGKEIL